MLMSLGLGLGLSLRSGRGGPVDNTAPTLSSATTGTTGLSTVMVFSEAVTGLAAADFALSTGQAISGVSGSGDTWTLTHAQVYQGQTPTLAYSGTAVEDAAGNALAAFAGTAIANNSTVVQAGTLQSGLQSFWELEEASGTRNDSHGTNHLTDNNTVTQTTGKVGNAAVFAAGNSEHLSGGDTAALTVGSGNFYVCAWIYVTGGSNFRRILQKGGNGSLNFEWGLFLNSSSQPAFGVRGNSGGTSAAIATWGSALSLNTWYFLEGTFDFATKTATVNVNRGTAVSATTGTMTSTYDSELAFHIGSSDTPAEFFTGRIDQAGVWKRLLSSTERDYLYNSGNGRSYAQVYAASP